MNEFFSMMTEVVESILAWLDMASFGGISFMWWLLFMAVGALFFRFVLWPALGGRIGFGFRGSDGVKNDKEVE